MAEYSRTFLVELCRVRRHSYVFLVLFLLIVLSGNFADAACSCIACNPQTQQQAYQRVTLCPPSYGAATIGSCGSSCTPLSTPPICSPAPQPSSPSACHLLACTPNRCASSNACAQGSGCGGGCGWFPISNLEPFDRYKKTFFQLWESEGAWIGTDDELRVTEANTFLRVAVPLNKDFDNILAFQPGFRSYFLDGPTIVDVPGALYDAQLSIVWRKTYSDRWQTNVWLQPKVRSDFETDDDIFFFSGGAYARYTYKPSILDLYMGAFYLDRDDISVLPAVGFVWTPTPDWRFEALLPRPKIARRIQRCGCREKWLYLSGQLGGGSFGVLRANGESDKLTLRDLRLFLGVETVRPGGAGLFAEAGYVFNRGIEYKNNEEVYEFGDSLMLRLGKRF